MPPIRRRGSFRPQLIEQITVPAVIRQVQLWPSAVQKAFACVRLGAAQTPVDGLIELVFREFGAENHFLQIKALSVGHAENQLRMRITF